MKINSIEQLGQAIRDGFNGWQSIADINVTPKDDLLLFNYNMHATFNGRWNWLERASRGLIMNTNGECIARPFDKFFSWGQHGFTTDAPIKHIYEKMDGSLGISYWHNGEIKVATRGSFPTTVDVLARNYNLWAKQCGLPSVKGWELLLAPKSIRLDDAPMKWNPPRPYSVQATWATERLKQKDFTNFHENWTLLFEIIYPENRVVVNYNGLETLTLLAIRDTKTGSYVHWDAVESVAHEFDFSLPDVWFQAQIMTPKEILKNLSTLTANEEGYVVEFEDGQRFKFKGDAYKILHKKISGLSFKNYLEAHRADLVAEYVADIPDEFMGDIDIWDAEITGRVDDIRYQVNRAMSIAPTKNRKDFALWCQSEVPNLMPYMFLALDGRSYTDAIYKREFNK